MIGKVLKYVATIITITVSTFFVAGKSKCDFLVLSGDKWREKKIFAW